MQERRGDMKHISLEATNAGLSNNSCRLLYG